MADEPIVEGAPDVQTVDVVAIDAEPSGNAGTDTTTAAPIEPGAFWKIADEAFAEESEGAAEYLKDLTADTLKGLPGVSRQVLRDAVALYKKSQEAHSTALSEKDKWVETEKAKLEQARLDLARREAAFAALATDPELKAKLAVPEGDLPDAMTPEGIEARIDRAAAKMIQKRLDPFEQAAARTDLERRYLEFVHAHPEMKDPAFKGEVDAYLTDANKNGLRVRTPEAYEIVKGRRLAKADEERRASELAARQASAARMGRATASGAPSDDIPPHIARNPVLLHKHLEANPHLVKAILAAS